MTKNDGLHVDDLGQVIGISHHDGRIDSISLNAGERIELCFISSDGEKAMIRLLGVDFFAINNMREGNIIDRMYLWDLGGVPDVIRKRMLQVFSINSFDVLQKKFGDRAYAFHLECSYGAEMFAILRGGIEKGGIED